MKRLSAILPTLLLSTTLALASDWHTGKLTDTEKQEVPSGSSTTTYNTSNNGNGNRSGSAHTTSDTDTYQVFTIETPTKTYVVRQKLNFPWSKPANITLGEEVKFTISGNKMTILDDDNKQQKATIIKSSLTQSH